jgi:hypothetical protein
MVPTGADAHRNQTFGGRMNPRLSDYAIANPTYDPSTDDTEIPAPLA